MNDHLSDSDLYLVSFDYNDTAFIIAITIIPRVFIFVSHYLLQFFIMLISYVFFKPGIKSLTEALIMRI